MITRAHAPQEQVPQFEECNSNALRRAARAVGQLYDQHLAQSGLRGGQYAILVALSARGPLAVTQLARLVGQDRTTLNRVLQPLLRDGLVRISTAEADRRSRQLELSTAGRQRLAQARPHWEAAQAAFEVNYGVQRAAELRALLQTLHSVL